MKKVSRQELKEILEEHRLWLNGTGGNRADLRDAYLQRADLQGADLRGADLQRADLQGADLRDADLRDAYLQGADLRGAYLQRAYLRGADLRGADLQRADLQGADLRDADLRGADLQRADLQGADLRGADLQRADLQGADLRDADLAAYQIPQHGELRVYKKVDGRIVHLLIPRNAKRTASMVGRKCRAEFAKVLAVQGDAPVVARPFNGKPLEYRIGEIVRPDSYDSDPRVECTHGIHFFLTREEAEAFR